MTGCGASAINERGHSDLSHLQSTHQDLGTTFIYASKEEEQDLVARAIPAVTTTDSQQYTSATNSMHALLLIGSCPDKYKLCYDTVCCESNASCTYDKNGHPACCPANWACTGALGVTTSAASTLTGDTPIATGHIPVISNASAVFPHQTLFLTLGALVVSIGLWRGLANTD